MLAVRGRGDDDGVWVVPAPEINKHAMQRRRQMEMFRLKHLEGWTTIMVALYFRCTPQWVNQELREMKESEKRRVLAEYLGNAQEAVAVG